MTGEPEYIIFDESIRLGPAGWDRIRAAFEKLHGSLDQLNPVLRRVGKSWCFSDKQMRRQEDRLRQYLPRETLRRAARGDERALRSVRRACKYLFQETS